VLVVCLTLTWLLWSGIYDNGLLFGLGAISVLGVTALSARFARVSGADLEYRFGLRIIGYIPWIMWEIIKANWDVIKLILSPELPISPRLIRVPASQQTALGQVLYANSITLTPGTISLDLRDGRILVHALTADTAAGVESGEMDRRVRRVEGG